MLLYKVVLSSFPEADPPELVYPSEMWMNAGRTEMLCRICHSINRSLYPKPLDIVLEGPPEEGLPCVPVETTGVKIWHQAFLDQIRNYMGHFVFGQCVLSDGTTVSDYATCYCRKSVLIRGNRQSRYRKCQSCGSIQSSVKPGPQYVLSCYLDGSDVYQDAAGDLYFTEKAAEIFHFKGWEVRANYYSYCLTFETLAVRDEPIDGQMSLQ